MRNVRALWVLVTVVAASSSSADMGAGTGVTGSVHDIGRYFNLSDPREACVYCHGAVHSRGKRGRGPESTEASPGFDAATRTCLSCHDGALAIDVPAGHHRVGFVYDAARGAAYCGPKAVQAKGKRCELKDKEARFAGTDMTIAERLWQVQGRTDVSMVTCATCHDPHNRGCDSKLDGENKLLMVPKAGGALCLSCHTATETE